MAEDVTGQEGDGVGLDLRGLVRRPVAAQVGHDDLEAGVGQGRDLVAPQPARVGEAVEQHHRPPLAGHLELDAHAVHVDAHVASSSRPVVSARLSGRHDGQQLVPVGPRVGCVAPRAPRLTTLSKTPGRARASSGVCEHAHDAQEGPEAVGVLDGGELQGLADLPAGIVGLVGLARRCSASMSASRWRSKATRGPVPGLDLAVVASSPGPGEAGRVVVRCVPAAGRAGPGRGAWPW